MVPKQVRWAEAGRFYLAMLIFIFATHLLANSDNISLHNHKWSRADSPPANSIHIYQTISFPPLPVLTNLATILAPHPNALQLSLTGQTLTCGESLVKFPSSTRV